MDACIHPYFRHVWVTVQTLFGHVSNMLWTCFRHVLDMFRTCFRHVSDIFLRGSGGGGDLNGKQNETANTKQNKFSFPARGGGGSRPFCPEDKKNNKKRSLITKMTTRALTSGSRDVIFWIAALGGWPLTLRWGSPPPPKSMRWIFYFIVSFCA